MRNRTAYLLFGLCALLLGVLLLLPIGMVVRGGFWVEGRFTLRYLAGVFRNHAPSGRGRYIEDIDLRVGILIFNIVMKGL